MINAPLNKISKTYTISLPSKKKKETQGVAQKSSNNLNQIPHYKNNISFKGLSCAQKMQDDLFNHLEKNIYKIEKSKGEFFIGTITDYLKSYIKRIDENTTQKGLLHGTMMEARESILKNGFDQSKITRTVCGPGTCFSKSEYLAHQLGGGAILECDFSGNLAFTQHGFFEKLKSNTEIMNDIAEITGIKIEPRDFREPYFHRITLREKHLGQYVRDIMTKKLNIDAVYDPGNQPCIPSCFVVYNTDCLSNLQKYNYK